MYNPFNITKLNFMNKLSIPIAIIVAGVIIAGAVIITKNADNVKPEVVNNEKPQLELTPITEKDHIQGNPNADIIIVEYSDFQCPYCTRFHGTMKRIMDDYGNSGKVAWVFRHFPIKNHPKAMPAAIASECVATLAGEDKFWDFSDQVFANQKENLEPEKMKEIAISLGADEKKYDACISENKSKERVNKDYEDGLKIAKVDPNFGTPYNILIPKNGQMFPLGGAVPYSTVKQIIGEILKEPVDTTATSSNQVSE